MCKLSVLTIIRKLSKIFILVFLLSGLSSCGKQEKNTALDDQILLYFLNSELSVGTPCEKFANSENSCISAPDSILVTCSANEISRLTNIIEPAEKRTEAIMNGFFNCWRTCNLVFGTQETICTKNTKFSTSKEYRTAQRSGTTSASQSWGICMNVCNKGESTEPVLSGSGATYPKSAY